MAFDYKHNYCLEISFRYRPSCVMLRNNDAWIAGGSGTSTSLSSSEFINLKSGSRRGPDLPFDIWGHETVKYREDGIYIIGGQLNKTLTNQTWIVNPKKGFDFSEGPPMNVRRRGHSCGTFVKDGETVIIVAGGFDHTLTDLDSVELLIPSSGKGWQFGKIFCFIEKIHLDIINFCRTKVTI